MKRSCMLLPFLLLIICWQGEAQRRMPPADRPGGQRAERLEKFRKMRLIEVLNLNEDEAVRFFAKQNVHEDRVRELMKARNDALDEIEHIVRENKDVKDIAKPVTDVLEIDKKLFAERERFHGELRDFLTPEQFAKFLVFERNFERQVRDALEEMRRDRPGRMGE